MLACHLLPIFSRLRINAKLNGANVDNTCYQFPVLAVWELVCGFAKIKGRK